MLDLKFVRENPEVVKQNIRNKFQDEKLPLVDEGYQPLTFINAQKVERYFRLLILTNHQLSEKHSYRSFSHRNESIFLSIIKQNEFLCNYYFVTSVFLELTEETKPCLPTPPQISP